MHGLRLVMKYTDYLLLYVFSFSILFNATSMPWRITASDRLRYLLWCECFFQSTNSCASIGVGLVSRGKCVFLMPNKRAREQQEHVERICLFSERERRGLQAMISLVMSSIWLHLCSSRRRWRGSNWNYQTVTLQPSTWINIRQSVIIWKPSARGLLFLLTSSPVPNVFLFCACVCRCVCVRRARPCDTEKLQLLQSSIHSHRSLFRSY